MMVPVSPAVLVLLLRVILFFTLQSVSIMAVPRTKLNITVFHQNHTWNEAYCLCKYYGMELLIIQPEEKYNALVELFKISSLIKDENQYWFGLYYDSISSQHKWVDNTTITTWTRWEVNGPNNIKKEKCIRMVGKTYKWRSTFCYKRYPVICQKIIGSCSMKPGPRPNTMESETLAVYNQTECIRRCEADWNCYSVYFSISNGTCFLYKSNNQSDFIQIMNSVNTDYTYRKLCFEGSEGQVTLNYTDTSDTPEFKCDVLPETTVITPVATTTLASSTPAATTTASTTLVATTIASSTLAATTIASTTLSATTTASTTSAATTSAAITVSATVLAGPTNVAATSPSATQIVTDLTSVAKCACPCPVNGPEEVQKLKETKNMIKDLLVPKSGTFIYYRKLISAPDGRSSAAAMGILGFLVTLLPIIVILLSDGIRMTKYLYKHRHNISKMFCFRNYG